MCTVRGEGERARDEDECAMRAEASQSKGESLIPPTSYLRPLGLNDKLYARQTRIKKIEKHACVV